MQDYYIHKAAATGRGVGRRLRSSDINPPPLTPRLEKKEIVTQVPNTAGDPAAL